MGRPLFWSISGAFDEIFSLHLTSARTFARARARRAPESVPPNKASPERRPVRQNRRAMRHAWGRTWCDIWRGLGPTCAHGQRRQTGHTATRVGHGKWAPSSAGLLLLESLLPVGPRLPARAPAREPQFASSCQIAWRTFVTLEDSWRALSGPVPDPSSWARAREEGSVPGPTSCLPDTHTHCQQVRWQA